MKNYSYMTNFAFNPMYVGAGASLGLAAGALSAGQLKDYKEGNAGEWSRKMLTNAAIGAGLGGLSGASAGLLLRSGKSNKYSSNVFSTPTSTPAPTQPVPKLNNVPDIDNYIQSKPGYMSSDEIKRNLDNPDYEWTF